MSLISNKIFKNKKAKITKQSPKRTNFFKSFVATVSSQKFSKISGVFFIIISIFLFLSFTSYFFTGLEDDAMTGKAANWMGKLGAVSSRFFIKDCLGIASYFLLLLFFNLGIKLLTGYSLFPYLKSSFYALFGILWVSAAMGFISNSGAFDELSIYTGQFGMNLEKWLEQYIGGIGVLLILVFTLLSFLIIVYNISFVWFKKKETEISESEPQTEKPVFVENTANKEGNTPIDLSDDDISPETPETNLKKDEEDEPEETDIELVLNTGRTDEKEVEEDKPVIIEKEHKTIDTLYDPKLELSSYLMPSLDLLDNYGSEETTVKQDELKANKDKIIKTLNNYGIEIAKIQATIGPTVTLYEIIPAPGVRISKIKNLEDDIALSLSAYGIRIIAPMPGKGTIGIEVPNQKPEIVGMKTILSSDKFQNSKFELPVGLGKTISNESYIVDLTKMPHILMAGATGQGKSVGLNAILTSLLYRKHPAEVKLVLIDPKKVELTLFSKIERHYLAKLPDFDEAIITDTRKVVRVLNSLCIEMDERYNLMKAAVVRNIKEYNEKFIHRKLNPNDGHKFMPYIVLVIDEFADLIMTAGKEIETPITRIAQLARAIGIHLIIATQRPSVNIITGTIKANFPARIAFRVTSKIDSRTILDANGAEQLIGRGDMLLSTGSDLLRLQCAFIDTHEIERVTAYIGDQRAYPDAYHLPEYFEEGEESGFDVNTDERDEFFDEAARIIVQNQHGSTSLIQRKLKLGYNRAGRIIDQLEAAGIIGSFEGSKAREVKIKDLSALEQLLMRIKNIE